MPLNKYCFPDVSIQVVFNLTILQIYQPAHDKYTGTWTIVVFCLRQFYLHGYKMPVCFVKRSTQKTTHTKTHKKLDSLLNMMWLF